MSKLQAELKDTEGLKSILPDTKNGGAVLELES